MFFKTWHGHGLIYYEAYNLPLRFPVAPQLSQWTNQWTAE